jgi:hypothetical protein
MKQLLEDWKRFLKEEEQPGEGIELYHATTHPKESFINGIDQKRSKGFGQGAGFYVHKDLRGAQKHAINLMNQSLVKDEPLPEGGQPIVVVIDEPVTPETFDIDYEAYVYGFMKFILGNEEHFQVGGSSRSAPYGIKISHTEAGPGVTFRAAGRISSLSLASSRQGGNPRSASIVAASAQKLAAENPSLFKRFEEEYLKDAVALKYNGEKTIYPLRIEDPEGNILWSRE